MANPTALSPTVKRCKPDSYQSGQEEEEEEEQPLLPGLPDHLSQICLSHVPAPLLYSVSRSWRRLIYSNSLPPFLSLYALLSSKNPHPIGFFSFDPISATWHPLPPPPPHPPLPLLLLRHPSFLSRHLSIQSISHSGRLILLAATTHHLLPAISRPLIFDPVSNNWRLGPRLSNPRRWCAAGSVSGSVYVASGVGSDYSLEVARSVERWELKKSQERWEKVAPLKDGKFSREAVDAVGIKGKLCMVNGAKEGAVYDVETDAWEEMPEGLLAGWNNGPIAAMDEGVIYAVDEGNGVLREYDLERDCWKYVIKSEYLKGAMQIAAGGGRVCAICSGGNGGISVVDVVTRPPRIWVVHPPPTTEVLAIHVLPRMSRPEE